jgi:hypothetical protein
MEMVTYNSKYFLIAIILFGIIFTIRQPPLYHAYALTYNEADTKSLKQTPLNYKFVQSSYEGNNVTEAVVNNNNNKNIHSNNNQIGTNDPSVIKRPNPWLVVLAFAISIAIVSSILIYVAYVLKGPDMRFGDIIRDAGGFPSLARFQFLLWTFIVMFAVLSIYFIRLFMGTPVLPNNIPTNLLILTGISVAVPFVSNPISTIKYGDRAPAQGTLKEYDRRRLATMLMENDKPTVSRFQMFAWTIISIIIYLSFFFSQTFSVAFISDINNGVPDIPQIFVYLMGLSQLAYVGNKATISQSLSVLQVAPHEATAGEDVIILGANFGKEIEKGKVLFEDGGKNITGKQVIVQLQNIVEWSDNRIHIKVPNQGLDLNKIYYIRVSNGSVMSYKAGGQDEEAKFTLK